MRLLPRTRAARLAAELAEVRDTAARADETACAAAERIDEMFGIMRDEIAPPVLPCRPALHLVSTDEGRPGAA